MRSWMIACSVGIVLAGFIPALPSLVYILLIFASCILLHCYRPARFSVLPFAGFLFGLAWFLLWAWNTQAKLWQTEDGVQDLLVQGRIWDLPQAIDRGQRFILRVDAFCIEQVEERCKSFEAAKYKNKLRLAVYYELPLAPGQRWQFTVRIKPVHGMLNPGAFDYEAWLIQQGISATGYVRESVLNQELSYASGRPWFNRLRFRLLQSLSLEYLSAHFTPLFSTQWSSLHLLRALSLGDRSGISAAEWEHFTSLGLNHLMVISGLHVGLVTFLLFRLALYLQRFTPWMLLYISAPQSAAAIAMFGAFLYAGLAGFSLPAFRAMLMAQVYLCGILFKRQTSVSNAFVLALLLVLLSDPMAPMSAGFWLSFVAVGILLSQIQRGEVANNKLWLALRVQFVLCLGMLPVMLVFFQQSSLAAPLVNLLAIPYVGFLIVPLALIGLVLLQCWPLAGFYVLSIGDKLLDVFMKSIGLLNQVLPQSLLSLPALSSAALLCLASLMLAFLLLKGGFKKGFCLLAMLVLLIWPQAKLEEGEVQLWVLDVGQGLAVLVLSRENVLLYDTGPRFSSGFDAGAEIIIPLLRKLGIKQIDQVVVSHSDLDHSGGSVAIAEAYPDAMFYSSDISIFGEGAKPEYCRQQEWQRDGVIYAFLHPDREGYDSNNSSCVLLIDTGETKILLPGDIEAKIERELIERQSTLEADIVLAPHHGSLSSSTSAFIKQVRPSYVIYSAGYLNRFAHPNEEVQRRYARAGAKPFNTAFSGAIRIKIKADQQEPDISEYRREHRRFWYRLADSP